MTPDLSIVIATHDRRDMVLRCVDGLRRQTADPDRFEVIVADDGSTDGTAQALESVSTPFRLRVLPLPKRGRAKTRNAGIEAADGAICLFLDADVIPGPQLVAEHLDAHRGADPAICFGHLDQELPEGRDWYAEAYARSLRRHFSELESEPASWAAGYGGNLSAPREALADVGGFDEELIKNEDIDLAYRLWRHGLEPRYLPRATGIHADAKRRDGLLRDIVRNGAGYRVLVDRHPGMMPRLYGWFLAAGPRELVLRRALIALRAPPSALAVLGNLLPAGRRQAFFYYLSRYAFWLAARRNLDRDLWVRITRGVPVLMYHAFDEAGKGDRFVVSRRTFQLQIRVLRALRYRVITFGELAETLRDSRPPPRRAVVLTVDDGYRDNLEIAQPILRRNGFRATFFLVSRRLGGINDWTAEGALAGRPLLTTEAARRLQAEGAEIGCHTRTHPRLPETGEEELRAEVAGSRRDLESVLGPVDTFAFPFGSHDERSVAAVAAAGFAGACTTESRRVRLNDDPMRIPRIEIRAGDSLLAFLRKLRSGEA